MERKNIPDNNTLSNYDNILNALLKTFCSSSRYSSIRIDLPQDNSVTEVALNIYTFSLHKEVHESIHKTLVHGRGVSFIPVFILPHSKKEVGHLCLVVFDAKTRTQHFFDPDGHYNTWLVRAVANRPPFVEGFRVASFQEDSWPKNQHTLQYLFDVPGRGSCGSFCVLIAVLCMRFGVGNPKLMAQLFISSCRKVEENLSNFTKRIWLWINTVSKEMEVILNDKSKPKEKEAAYLSVCDKMFHKSSVPICGVYCFSSKMPCERRSCEDDVMCWQHRYLIRNNDKKGKGKMKCSAKRQNCKNR